MSQLSRVDVEKMKRRIETLKDERRRYRLQLLEKEQELDMMKKNLKNVRPTHGRNSVKSSTLSSIELGNSDVIGKSYAGYIFHHFPFLTNKELNEYTPDIPNTVCGMIDGQLDHPPGLSDSQLEEFWHNSSVDLLNKKRIEKHANSNALVQNAYRGKYDMTYMFYAMYNYIRTNITAYHISVDTTFQLTLMRERIWRRF